MLVCQRTAAINRLLWRVHELDPSLPGIVHEDPADMIALTVLINELTERIEK